MKLGKKQLIKYGEYFELDFLAPHPTHTHPKEDGSHLVIADLHAPFHHEKYLQQTINDNLDVKDIWIIGDAFDFYSKSFFRKTASVDFKQEFRRGYEIIRQLASNFDSLYLMMANHDNRFAKWCFDNMPADIIEFAHVDLIEDLLVTIPNLKIIKTTVDRRNIGFIHKYKNVVFTHIEKSNKDITKTVQEIEKDIFSRWGDYLKLDNYDIVIQAHNHSSGKIRYGNRFLFQIPCMIDIRAVAFDYVFNGKMHGNPPMLGYMLMYENEGKIDPTMTNIVDYI